jgi:UDP-glucose 4-epimerase
MERESEPQVGDAPASSAHRVAGRTALVTGATGYMGPRLCQRLAESDATVYGVSRGADDVERDGVRWRRADLADLDVTRRLLEEIRPDLVFHLAGLAAGSRSLDLVLPTFRSNLTTTVALLTAAAELGCGRIVLTGSMEEPEPDESGVVPSSPYAASKWAASAYGRMFQALFDTPVTVARIFMVYGPGVQNERKLLPYVIRSLLTNEAPKLSSGERRIDWIYMDDVAEGLVRLAMADDVEGRTVDLGSGRLVSVREMVERVARIVGGPEPEFGALETREMEQVRAADVEATERWIGWCPSVPLDTGLRRTVDWHAARLRGEEGA